jgi:hypothetical protein
MMSYHEATPEIGVGAPETQIEITPAMIEAGCEALYVRDWGEELGEWAVTRVYRAMEAARRASFVQEFR